MLADDFRYDLSKGLRPRRSVRSSMQHEILMYSIVQKEGLGLDKAIEEVKHRCAPPTPRAHRSRHSARC